MKSIKSKLVDGILAAIIFACALTGAALVINFGIESLLFAYDKFGNKGLLGGMIILISICAGLYVFLHEDEDPNDIEDTFN